jgi:large subunit ribosomal protein L14e
MYEIGRICIKLAGRDAGREAVIVDILDDKYVLVDGNVRRRKCNIIHLEPTSKTIEIRKNAPHDDVAKAFKELGFAVWETKAKQEKEKPVKVRGKKAETAEQPKEKKKKEKKVVKEAKVVEEKKEKKSKEKTEAKEEKPKKKTAKKE